MLEGSHYDLCKVKILSNASCNCGAPCENSHHFFFDCDKYTDNREIIFNSTNKEKRKENKYFWKCVLVL
jgi:hypothetical protein